jgi:hypothetical protein
VIAGPSGPWCEIWFRKSIPTGAKPADNAIVFPIAQGTLIGILRFPGNRSGPPRPDHQARRLYISLQQLPRGRRPPGRRSAARLRAAHAHRQRCRPQRDAGLRRSGQDEQKASGTPHPAVFSIETPAGSTFPAVTKEGDHDWVLNVKIGDLPFAIIVAQGGR